MSDRKAAVGPTERRGTPSSGRIVTLMLGQGHGFIRLTSTRKVFFHRSDLCEGTSFQDLAIGNRVTFELLEDAISGPRALRVERVRGSRPPR
ncbi:MAG TPA: cold shock domain-containing protein [Vicinamibacterales bacterium]|nr:cold shock domain-containing protein [Vicinamibacterales bacterium]